MSRRRRGDTATRRREQPGSTDLTTAHNQPPFAQPARAEAVERQEELFPAQVQLRAAAFSGPLPHPRLLREYDVVLPGLAERIVGNAEDEARHRRSVESGLLRLSYAGLASGTLVVLVTLVGGILLLYAGRNIGGLAALTAALVALVAAYLGRSTRPPADTATAGKEEDESS